jgi:hypothetical protein
MTAFVAPESAIESDAETTGAAVGQNFAKVRREAVLRVFRGDAALDREAALLDLILRRQRQRLRVHRDDPCAMRIWLRTMSMPVISSVTVCSTWMRGFISMKYHSPDS